jgi:predicted transcriptional regulator
LHVMVVCNTIDCMTTTLTIRLPEKLARQFKSKARAANTTPTEVLREAAQKFVTQSRSDGKRLNAMQRHIDKYAGNWDGDISGEELLRLTRPS